MPPKRQAAYRFLLYEAMLTTRMLCQWRDTESNDAQRWHKQYLDSRTAGAIADWMHNLAACASRDFGEFREDDFWRLPDGVTQLKGYKEFFRAHFDRFLEREG